MAEYKAQRLNEYGILEDVPGTTDYVVNGIVQPTAITTAAVSKIPPAVDSNYWNTYTSGNGFPETDGLAGSKTGWDSMYGKGGLALGGLQAGVSLMGTLDAMKTAKLQRKLLGQQYETNNEKMSHWRDSNAGVVSAFTGGGLAASGVKP